MRFAGFLMPVLLVLYGVLVAAGLAPDAHYAGHTVFASIMLPWLFLGAYQFLYPAKTWQKSGVRFAFYHVFAVAYVLFVSGFATPFITTWLLLFMAAYAFFAGIGLVLSALILSATAIIDILLRPTLEQATADLLTTASLLLVGVAVIAISRIQEIDGAELSRSKALESLQRDRILTIVNNLADAVLSTDKDGVVRVYNAASLNLLDTNASLNGHHVDEILQLYDGNDKPFSVYGQLKKLRGVSVRDDLTMSMEGETIRLEVTFSPIRSNFSKSKRTASQDGYILILRDVTKTKSLEEERDEFISVVSHELRTPITVAEGTISNVQVMMDRPDISDDILKEGVATAHDQIIFLSRMVNDLSTLSRAERGVADEAETINVRQMIDDLYNEYAPQAEAKGLHFNLDVGTRLGEVAASRLYLKELLQNFVTNALKYTKEGSVTVHVTRKDGKITFEVRDTGIGISKSDQAKVFNKFYRSEDYRTRETGGTGLGLYVAIKLAKKLGTKIELKSRLNHGSSFSFTLPASDKKR